MFVTLKWLLRTGFLLAALLSGPLLMMACSGSGSSLHWSEADRSSTGMAPTPEEASEALVQVYAARAFGWRSHFAVHTWVATKEAEADTWYVHEVMGWHSTPVRSTPDLPDRSWYGAQPRLLAELRGPKAAEAISNIQKAVASYPYPDRYQAWPGPNSNTFTAWVIRETPQLALVLPNIAIGKDYPAPSVFASTPSDSGYQVNLGGVLGISLALEEGLEINLLGLNLGIDPWHLGIKLPGIGQLSLRDPWPEPPSTSP
ncbi:DUF3750 domain-containing protein [Marinospirillum sp.]|uniref:DUF3750 domain-containing protein n=1 Tax=Marinospirillum sp. TaxID=2183934 RepID=UPI00286FE6FE|nr:DUF3750 domain-containing protein [Marinospirillum sp.]MDR9467320.1 DUF3750 domain-containing protein [Marinospirillum sp.]